MDVGQAYWFLDTSNKAAFILPFHLILNSTVDHIEIVSINSLLFVMDGHWWKCDHKVQFRLQTTGTKNMCIIDWVYIKVIDCRIWFQMDKISMNQPLFYASLDLFALSCKWFLKFLYNKKLYWHGVSESCTKFSV